MMLPLIYLGLGYLILKSKQAPVAAGSTPAPATAPVVAAVADTTLVPIDDLTYYDSGLWDYGPYSTVSFMDGGRGRRHGRRRGRGRGHGHH